jgi:hypothetical protein
MSVAGKITHKGGPENEPFFFQRAYDLRPITKDFGAPSSYIRRSLRPDYLYRLLTISGAGGWEIA